MSTTVDELSAFLRDLGITTLVTHHPPLFTVEQSRTLRGEIAGAHTKNLFLKDKKGGLFLIVTAEDASINLKRLHEKIDGAGRLSFGNPELLNETLGVTPGSVSAFGLINDQDNRVTILLDKNLMSNDKINCHPLVNTATTTIAAADLLIFIRATGHEPRLINLEEPQPMT